MVHLSGDSVCKRLSQSLFAEDCGLYWIRDSFSRVQVILFWIVLLVPLACHSETFTLYTYHNKPPYYLSDLVPDHSGIPEADTGDYIYETFVRLLNQALRQRETDDGLTVKLKFQPRKRLEEQLVAKHLNGAIIGVHPVWFEDKARSRYLWSDAFMQDQDVVVVRRDSALNYTTPQDLMGMKMALPRGHYFWGVNELVEKGQIQRIETNADRQNLQMVLLGRADATITSYPTFLFYASRLYRSGQLQALPHPHDRFDRYLLFPRSQEGYFAILSTLVNKVAVSKLWLQLLDRLHRPQLL
ncbi:MAG: transporter substrate-binding domain-containing protein [Pseudomonadales bacterium]|nr:transporter substrate-binding domain-containing protein [Pseudomonadales bacterium]